jgi:hypothetical protein
MSTLWMEILPGPLTTRVLVQDGPKQTLLRAQLPHSPRHPRAVQALCEAVALWSGRKVCVALIVEGPAAFCATRLWLDTFDALAHPLGFEIHFVTSARPALGRRVRECGDQTELGSCRDLRRRIFSEVER